jgi:hypothetical protein
MKDNNWFLKRNPVGKLPKEPVVDCYRCKNYDKCGERWMADERVLRASCNYEPTSLNEIESGEDEGC